MSNDSRIYSKLNSRTFFCHSILIFEPCDCIICKTIKSKHNSDVISKFRSDVAWTLQYIYYFSCLLNHHVNIHVGLDLDLCRSTSKETFFLKYRLIFLSCCRCSCNGGCEPMPTVRESVCCKEIQRVVEKMDAYTAEGELGCITSHPGFERVCLDPWVLEIASYHYIQKYGGRARRDASENEYDTFLFT